MAVSNKPDLPEDFGSPWMANLQEIELPETVPFTPETIGWYLLGSALGVALVWLAWRLLQRWRANAYRRTALQELSQIEQLARAEATRPDALQGLPPLLKRVALVAYPRTEVAELAGDAWLGFLDGTLGSTDFTRGVGSWLPQLAYDPGSTDRMSATEASDLVTLARRWIRDHR